MLNQFFQSQKAAWCLSHPEQQRNGNPHQAQEEEKKRSQFFLRNIPSVEETNSVTSSRNSLPMRSNLKTGEVWQSSNACVHYNHHHLKHQSYTKGLNFQTNKQKLTCSANHPMILISVELLGEVARMLCASDIAIWVNMWMFECIALNHCDAMCSSGQRRIQEFLASGEWISNSFRCGSGMARFRQR